MNKPICSGYIDNKFIIVKDLVDHLLSSNDEEGCAITLYIDGHKVIDIWGGWANKEKEIPWQHDTIVSTFSVSKALVSTLGHILVDRNEIDLNKPVATYWKNFGKFGKNEILVRNLFDHTCAITFVDKKLNFGDLYNWDLMIEAIENTKPNWDPGEKPVYLNMTYGYLVGGLIQKVSGLKLSAFNRKNFSNLLNIDYNFSLKPHELQRVATVYRKVAGEEFLEEPMKDPCSIFAKSMQGFGKNEDFNSANWRGGEVGSGQGHGNARSIANMFEMLRNKELGVSLPNYRTETRYPAFHDIVRLELQKNFNEKELRTKGLAVETNLDPVLQDSLENNLQKTKLQLIKKYGSRLEDLEGAAIAVDISSGEVKAVAGSTEPSSYGFNRSINAIRPIGSLVKPFIYLTALDQYNDYNLTTLLDDSKLSLMSGGKLWEPDNFDKKFHGKIPLHVALWQSYNIASARLGLDLGYEAVENMFLNLGITKDVPNYPSLFIGSFELSPYQAIQAYQTIASDGFYSPLRSIRQIKDTEGKIEFSYPYSIDQTIRPEPVALLKFAMQQTFERGTARGYSKKQIQLWNAGGKTGTSDDQRDSWFVGFAGELLVLVWLGFDDNRQTPLTGRTGAFQVWKNFINDIKPVKTTQSSLPRINYVWTDIGDGLRSGKKCKNSILIPFIEGTEPNKIPDVRRECSSKIESSRNTVMDKLKEVFEVGQG